MFEAIRSEFKTLTRSESLFILFMLLCSFLIQADYAAIRPVSNAIFISSYGSSWFPYAWLATVPLNFLLISWYNKYLPRWGCFRTFLTIITTIISFNLFCALFLKKLSWLPFAFYIWKEVYIMLMFQQIWSVIHSTIKYSQAKYLYGIIFGIGALGAIAGSILPGFFAVTLGSENLLFATLPIYLLLGISYAYALRHTQGGLSCRLEDETKRSSLNAFFHGISLIRSSSFLLFILLIVLLMQLSSTLIDYQFNHFVQTHILEKDLRTQYTGRVLGIVHTATLALQFFGSFLLVHFLGVKRSHFFIPLVLGLNNLAFIFMPTFGLITFSYVTVKCFDFSLFGIVKEMMYIPLKKDDKFRAKAFIDVFAHRTAKACASFLIFGMQWLMDDHLQMTVALLGLCIFTLWCLLVRRILKEEPVMT